MAPGQNFFTCNICTKGKYLMEKERTHYNLILISYMGTIIHDLVTYWNTKKRDTQNKASKSNHLIIFPFSSSFFSRSRENVGFN